MIRLCVSMKRRGPGSFSLIELLVALAIVSLLAAVALPAMKNSIDASRSTKCLSNLRQIGIVAASFSGDNGGIPVPPSYYFLLNSRGYVATNSPIWVCPEDTRADKAPGGNGPLSYASNNELLGFPPQWWTTASTPLVRVNQASQTVYFCDATNYFMNLANATWAFRHQGKINALFFDYHAESLSFTNTSDFRKMVQAK